MGHRAGEDDQTRFRTDRCFRVGDEYFFSTREGIDIGPYKSRQAAEKGVKLFIHSVTNEEMSGIYATKIAMQGVWASTLYH